MKRAIKTTKKTREGLGKGKKSIKPFIIIVTGTPGTGKTFLAKFLAKKLGFEHIDLNEQIKNDLQIRTKLRAFFDKKRQCYAVDIKELKKMLIALIKRANRSNLNKKEGESKTRGFIIDSHISHFLPCKYADICIVCRCSNIAILKKRLKKRNYSKAKVRENIDAEIFEVCLREAEELGHRILTFDSARGMKILSNAEKKVKKSLKSLI